MSGRHGPGERAVAAWLSAAEAAAFEALAAARCDSPSCLDGRGRHRCKARFLRELVLQAVAEAVLTPARATNGLLSGAAGQPAEFVAPAAAQRLRPALAAGWARRNAAGSRPRLQARAAAEEA